MPAIDQWVTLVVSLPGWTLVSAAVLLTAIALADDRVGKAQSIVAKLGRDGQLLLGTGIIGFVVGLQYDLSQLGGLL